MEENNMNTNCPLCNKLIKRFTIGKHMKDEHPEYSFTVNDHTGLRKYYCGTCGSSIGNFTHLVYHYKNTHNTDPHVKKHYVGLGTPCCVCDEIVGTHQVSNHFKLKHHEYGFTKLREGSKTYYKCNICKTNLAGFKPLVHHYKEKHPTKTNEQVIIKSVDNIPNIPNDFSLQSITELIHSQNQEIKTLRNQVKTLEDELNNIKVNYSLSLNDRTKLATALIEAQELLTRRN